MGQGFDFFQNHLIPLCYFGFSAIKECCPQPNAVLSWGSGMPCRIRVSAPCVLYSLLLVMAFLLSAAAALGGWLCREQLTLTLNSFQEHFPRHLFSFGITLIWPFVSTVTSVQSYWFRRFFPLRYWGLFLTENILHGATPLGWCFPRIFQAVFFDGPRCWCKCWLM